MTSSYTFHWQHKYQVSIFNKDKFTTDIYSSDHLKDIIDIYINLKCEDLHFHFKKNRFV